jgi:DNA-binding HxlR family transcriptional regulator
MSHAVPIDIPRDDCSVARTLQIIGERWTMLVLREAFYGVRRFADMQVAVGCAKSILSERLDTLVHHGILRREPYREDGQRERFEYRLTEKGLALFPIVIALMQWGDQFAPAPNGPPVDVLHRGCGCHVKAELRCEHEHGPLTARDTEPRVRRRRRASTRVGATPKSAR